MSRLNKDEYFMNIARVAALRCTCPRRAVGAVLVDENDHILSTGYNGTPRGFVHCIDRPCPGADDPSGQTSRCFAVHAEQNAILQCHDPSRIAALYTTTSPCFVCTKMLLNLPNLKRVVVLQPYPDVLADAMWLNWKFDPSHVFITWPIE